VVVDRDLSAALAAFGVGAAIPERLYDDVAELLARAAANTKNSGI
jgi:type III secretion system FlhB-like substrate exporter